MGFAIGAFALLLVGYIRATPETLNLQSFLERFLYRAFVAYPESIAAAVSFTHEYGKLGELVMPTIRGLMRHDQVNLSLALHLYQAGSPGGASVPMAAEAFIAAGWPGIILVLPMVYIVLILLQELAFCMNEGLTSIAFSALYSYLAIGLSLNGMFSTLFNFMFPGTLILLGLAVLLISRGLAELKRITTRISPRTT